VTAQIPDPGRHRARRLLAVVGLVVVATAALAGCGASTSSAPPAVATTQAPATAATAPAPQTPPVETLPAGATPSPAGATPLPAGSFTFDLPGSWRAVPLDASHDGLVADLRKTNPAFADSLQARLANAADATSYFAFDGSSAAVKAGDLATLAVTEVDLPPTVSLETFATTVQKQVSQLVESDVELRKILVTAGQAYSLAYTAPLTRPDGQPGSVAVTQVLYVLPGRGYVLTFSTPTDRANDYAQVVADMATSFTIRT
jgi:hypothetical protein